MSAWQPIATAPRDGSEIDLWCIGPPNERFDIPFRVADVSWDEEMETWGDNGAPDSWFSHWMPTPPPPPTGAA